MDPCDCGASIAFARIFDFTEESCVDAEVSESLWTVLVSSITHPED